MLQTLPGNMYNIIYVCVLNKPWWFKHIIYIYIITFICAPVPRWWYKPIFATYDNII